MLVSTSGNHEINDYTVQEIATIHASPVLLDFVDYLNCPVCDFEITIGSMIINDNSSTLCENCGHKIKFMIKTV